MTRSSAEVCCIPSPLPGMIRAAVTTTSPSAIRADRAWVDVDLDGLVANARRVAEVSGARLLPMVKGNGYGLGAVPVARALERIEPWGYGVAAVEEARELRAAGIDRPIVLFTPALGSWLPAIRAAGVRPVLSDLDTLRRWLADSGGAPFHVSIDTGMARGGFRHADRALLAELARELEGATGYEGICTHFHSADTDPVATGRCWEDFEAVVRALGRRPPLVHAANSAAAMAGTRYAADMARPGI